MAARIYLDHAATTPMRPQACAALADANARWANPSSPHAEGRAMRAAFERARETVAEAHGWTGELVFTSGASEALAIALTRSAVSRRIVSATEHDAVLRAADGADVVPVDDRGLVAREALTATLAGAGRPLVAIQWANSETGVRQPIAGLAEAIHAVGGLLLVDAAQMPPGADIAVAAHADFVALSGHKHGGPPGIGALLVRDPAMLMPSGGQERGLRGGTENVPAALAWAAALATLPDVGRDAALRRRVDAAVQAAGGTVVAEGAPRHPAIGSYRFPGRQAASLLIRLDLAGIAVSAGSACSSGSIHASHVLTAMGYAPDAAREVIRISLGWTTTEAEVDRLGHALAAIVRPGARAA